MAVENSLVSALTGLGGGVHALQKPQTAALPAIVYRIVSQRPWKSHDAVKLITRYRVQIVCMASTYAAMRSLADAVEAKLWCNRTDFVFSEPAGPEVNLPDEREGNLRVTTRDYFLWE